MLRMSRLHVGPHHMLQIAETFIDGDYLNILL